MQRIITIPERKATELARRQAALAKLIPVLTEYAKSHGGRYLLFGSAARGTMKYDSDIDILMDFTPDALNDAWTFAETACWDRGLEPDLLPYDWSKSAFLEHIAPDIRVLA